MDENEIETSVATDPPSDGDQSGAGEATGSGNGNGNGASLDDAIGEPEYFLIPLLASDPVPYLFDGEGNFVDAEGDPVSEEESENDLPPGIRRLQAEALAPAPCEDSDS